MRSHLFENLKNVERHRIALNSIDQTRSKRYMLIFLKELLLPRIAVVKDNTVTYRTDYCNLLYLTNLVAIFIILKQFRRIELLAQLCDGKARTTSY